MEFLNSLYILVGLVAAFAVVIDFSFKFHERVPLKEIYSDKISIIIIIVLAVIFAILSYFTSRIVTTESEIRLGLSSLGMVFGAILGIGYSRYRNNRSSLNKNDRKLVFVRIEGLISYKIMGEFIEFYVERIQNNRNGTTGSLLLELWATKRKYTSKNWKTEVSAFL